MGLQTSGYPDTSRDCWVNLYMGKSVKINLAIATQLGTGLLALSGTALRIDKFQHRFYVVLQQENGPTNVNIDYILTIEEK